MMSLNILLAVCGTLQDCWGRVYKAPALLVFGLGTLFMIR